jgi:hypothetical protein
MDSLEAKHWILIAMGVYILIKIISRVLNPPKPLQWSEVPLDIREAIEANLSGFVVESQRERDGRGEWLFQGAYKGHSGRVEIECDRDGRISEFEFGEGQAVRMTTNNTPCEFSEVPRVAMDHLRELMGSETERFQPSRVRRATMKGEVIFDIEGRTPTWEWEIKMTESGRLVELEKEVPRA